MIYGIGTDLVQMERMEKSLQSPAFWQRVFGEEERAFLQTRQQKRQVEGAAANFAAKEAFLKAMGTGIGGFELHELQVLRQPSGAPYFKLCGKAAQWMEQNHITLHISLSHDAGMAQAFVILEQSGER